MPDDPSERESQTKAHQDPMADGRSRYSNEELERVALDTKSSLNVRALAELARRKRTKGEGSWIVRN